MNPLAAMGAILALGVAGLDPFGALIVVPALSAGARRRVVLVFFGAALLTTVAVGVLLGESVQHVSGWLSQALSVPTWVRATVELAGAAALAGWAVRRWTRRDDPARPRGRTALAGSVGMLLAGVGWGASALSDPSFYGVAAIASRLHSTTASVAAYTGWFLLSQAPLVALVIALTAGRRSRPVRRLIVMARRLAKPSALVMTVLLALLAVLLVGNAATLLVTGAFWPI